MSSNITNPSSTTVKNKISKNEKNLVVSFIQFLRHKVSANEFNQEQSDSLEGFLFFFFLNFLEHFN